MRRFDACITIGPHHLAAASLEGRPDIAVEAVRSAVRRMDGSDWVDVVAETYPLECQGWVILRRSGCGDSPDTPAWLELVRTVETVALAAMVAAGAPFKGSAAAVRSCLLIVARKTGTLRRTEGLGR
jgi:hypothetical protein